MATPDGALTLPPNFNPHTQNITLLYPDGTPLIISLSDIDFWTQDSIRMIAIFASQVGASLMVLFLLAVLTKPEKRKTPIFIFNVLSLLLVCIRSVLQICYFTGGWYTFFAFWAYYFDDVPRRDYGTSIAASVLALCLQITIMISLVLQVRVVYSSHPRVNMIMTLLSAVVALTSVSFFTVVTVQGCRAIITATTYVSPWVYSTARALLAAAITFFSAVFIVKLGMAIRQRRILGLEKWGPLQIIFAMGCQTLIVPSIFSIIENVNSVYFDGMSSLTTFLVAISLPISSMWASASAQDKSTFSPSITNRSGGSGSGSGTSSRLIKSGNNSHGGGKVRHGSACSTGSTMVGYASHYSADEEKGRRGTGAGAGAGAGAGGERLKVEVERTVDVEVLGDERV